MDSSGLVGACTTLCLVLSLTIVSLSLSLSQLFMAARAAKYSYICQRVDYSDDPNEVRVSVVHRQYTSLTSVSIVRRSLPPDSKS